MDDGSRDGRPGRRLGRYDLHVHTSMSDGDLSLEEVVAVAAERGVTVGIADHVSNRNPALFVSNIQRLDEYLRALSTAPVFRSGELCWCDGFSASLTPEVLARFDYLIGSNHGFELPDGQPISPWSRSLPGSWASDPQQVMEIFVDRLCEMLASMPIAIIGHPTLLPPALLSLEPEVHEWWTEERESRFIEAAIRGGVAIEISNRYRLPHDRFLRSARAAGATFSLGSDGHQRGQVARLDWAVETARRVGIGYDDLFVPERQAIEAE
jgi:histidinol phosphatase-like PHP family hydrolase